MDFRAVAIIIIAVIIVWYYFNFTTVFWLAVLGLFIAAVVFIFTILRSEGYVKKFTKWFKIIGKKYKKLERKIFKFWDEL